MTIAMQQSCSVRYFIVQVFCDYMNKGVIWSLGSESVPLSTLTSKYLLSVMEAAVKSHTLLNQPRAHNISLRWWKGCPHSLLQYCAMQGTTCASKKKINTTSQEALNHSFSSLVFTASLILGRTLSKPDNYPLAIFYHRNVKVYTVVSPSWST